MELSELDHDALTEVVNIAVGQAASGLSDMVGEAVELSVPDIKLLSSTDAKAALTANAGDDLALVRQNFEGRLNGESMLIFPEENSLHLVRLILQEDLPLETLAELEQEVLSELGNVLLNGFVGSIANVLDLPIGTGLPEFDRLSSQKSANVFETDDAGSLVLVIHVDFHLREENIRGYLALVVGVRSIETLLDLVRKYVGL